MSRRPASTRSPAWAGLGRRCASSAPLGKTVVLTTHFMDEAQALADRIAVMVNGRDGRPSGRPEEIGGRPYELPTEVRFRLPCPASGSPPCRRYPKQQSARRDHNVPHHHDRYGLAAVNTLTGWALERGPAVAQPLEVSRPWKTSTWP